MGKTKEKLTIQRLFDQSDIKRAIADGVEIYDFALLKYFYKEIQEVKSNYEAEGYEVDIKSHELLYEPLGYKVVFELNLKN